MGCGASTAKGPEQRVVKSCEAEINVEDARTLLADAGVRAHDAHAQDSKVRAQLV